MKEKLAAIHDQALQILETIGIKLHHAELIQRIRQQGVSVNDDTVFFEPGFIMDAIRRAPSSFTLHGRNPCHDVVIGGHHVNCAPGYGCAAISAPDGTRRKAVLADYVRLAKLVHQCSHFKVNGGILAQPSDVPADQGHLLMLYYEKFIMDIQIIDMVKYYIDGLDVAPGTLNLELIRRVGPGGQFLTTMDTAKKCRTHSWNPLIGVRGNAGGGSPSDKFLDSIADRQRAMLEGYSPPPMDRVLLAELDDRMLRQGVDRSWLSAICSQVWETSNTCNSLNRRRS